MSYAHRYLLCLLLFVGHGFLHAQFVLDSEFTGADVLVHGRQNDPESSELIFQAVWRNVPDGKATFSLQRMSGRQEAERLMLDQLMEAALGVYLDTRIHFSKQGVTADLPASGMALEMNAMIFSALEGLGLSNELSGLSASTRKQLERLVNIDWSQARNVVDAGMDQDKYLAIYYYVRSQRDELERQIRADLLPLATIPVLGPREQLVDLARTVEVGSTCGTVFDQDNYLCALDIQLADTGSGGVDPELAAELSGTLMDMAMADEEAPVEEVHIRKRDRWLKAELDKINQRIEKADQRKELWELRDRLEDLEDRLTGLELEVQEGKPRGTAENPLANLSDLTGHNITIRFARNGVQVDQEYQVLLNEVFEQLARSPQDRVLITGYSDRNGNSAASMELSERRAKAVRNYLLQRGIAAERLLLNFYGDSRSTTADPSQRRVEIEWLQQGR